MVVEVILVRSARELAGSLDRSRLEPAAVVVVEGTLVPRLPDIVAGLLFLCEDEAL